MPSPPSKRRPLGDRLFGIGLPLLGAALLVLALVIFFSCFKLSRPALAKIGVLHFFFGRDWNPVQDSFGALAFVYGTLVTSLVAMVLALPVSVGLALFLTEMAPRRIRTLVATLVQVLASIPSVVYGLWGLMVLVPLLRSPVEPWLTHWFGFLPVFGGPPIGLGYLAAGIILSIMILPTIASVTVEVLRTMPSVLREGALALGATRWEAIRLVVLPYARRGIWGAAILGLNRALGETMAVTMVIGNQPEIHTSLFSPGYTLPSVIANEFAEAGGDIHTGALAALALALFFVSLCVSATARYFIRATRSA